MVIVTGGTSGLGRCIAIDCAKAGARGVQSHRMRHKQGGSQKINKMDYEWAAFVAVDLGDEAAATKIMDAAVAALAPRIFANSLLARGDLETTTPELWDMTMHTNAAPFLLTQALATAKAESSRFAVNIGSCAHTAARPSY